MVTYNAISNSVFDFLLAPFGHEFAGFDLVLWPVLGGIVALLVYKWISNQKAIVRVKKQISMHLLEIRLFRDDVLQVIRSTLQIFLKNFLYLGHNLLPAAVMLVPMVAIMVQLVAHYAYAPARPGESELLELRLDPETGISPRDVSLSLPAGVALEAPPVRTSDGRVFWALRAESEGDHVLQVDVAGDVYEKGWAVGGEARKVPVKRLRSWEALLYPGEDAIPSGSPVVSLELGADTRRLGVFPDGEFGILAWFLLLSLAAGVALKGLFGVTL